MNSRSVIALATAWLGACLAIAPVASPTPPDAPPTSARDVAWFRTLTTGDDRPLCACLAPGSDPHVLENYFHKLDNGLPANFAEYARWSSTANGISTGNGNPITLTYSFVPDGTLTSGSSSIENDLFATLDGQFGTTDAWQDKFRETFTKWSADTGIIFVEETNDDGAAWPDSPGVLGVRGDIRIIATSIDGASNILAYNYFPNLGDMALDTGENWANSNKDYRFLRNIFLHELGHGIGLEHTYPVEGTKLMEPYLTTSFLGPQDDDIRGGVWFYGDPFERNADAAHAADLGTFSDGLKVTHLALHNANDEDWYYLAASSSDSIAVTASPIGSTYDVGDSDSAIEEIDTSAIAALKLEIYDETGSELLRANYATAGDDAAAAPLPLPSGDGGIIIRVYADPNESDVQRYKLSFAQQTAELRTLSINTAGGDGLIASVAPADIFGKAAATMPASLTYQRGDEITITAPAGEDPLLFDRWFVDGVPQTAGERSVTVTLDDDLTVTANYGVLLQTNIENIGPIVLGESRTLIGKATGGEPPYTYAWSPGATLSSTTSATVTATPTVATTYTFTVTDSNGITASAEATVEIVDPISCSAGEDTSTVAGKTVNLHATVAGGNPPYSYAWSPTQVGGAFFSANYSPTIEQATTFTLTVTDADGRVATDTVDVGVVEVLAVSIGDQLRLKSGNEVTIEAAITGGTEPYSIEWYVGGKFVGEGLSAIQISPESDTVVLAIVTDASDQTATDDFRIDVYEPLSVIVSPSFREIESGQSIALRAMVAGGATPYRYTWFPADSVDAPNSSLVRATPGATTTYTVRVTDDYGETATGVATVQVYEAAPTPTTQTPTNSPPADDTIDIVPTPTGLCGFGVPMYLVLTALLLIPTRRR